MLFLHVSKNQPLVMLHQMHLWQTRASMQRAYQLAVAKQHRKVRWMLHWMAPWAPSALYNVQSGRHPCACPHVLSMHSIFALMAGSSLVIGDANDRCVQLKL